MNPSRMSLLRSATPQDLRKPLAPPERDAPRMLPDDIPPDFFKQLMRLSKEQEDEFLPGMDLAMEEIDEDMSFPVDELPEDEL